MSVDTIWRTRKGRDSIMEKYNGHTLDKVHVEPHCYFAVYLCLDCNAHGPFNVLVKQPCTAKEARGTR